MKGYRTKSNREAGTGRCDLFVKPVSRRKEAFIVEFKKTKNQGAGSKSTGGIAAD